MATIQEAFDALREKGAKGVEGALNTPLQISLKDAPARLRQIEQAGDAIGLGLEDALKAFGVLGILDQQIDLGAPIIEEAEAEAEIATDAGDRFFIDPLTASIFRGLLVGRFRTGQDVQMIGLLAQNQGKPLSIGRLASEVLGTDAVEEKAQMRSKVAKLNGMAKFQKLPRPILHTRGGEEEGYALNHRSYTLLTELLNPSEGNQPKEPTLEDIATAWRRTPNRARVIIDALVADGCLVEGEDVQGHQHGRRTIRRYTPQGYGKLMGLAPVLANSGRVEVADLLAALRQDQARTPESVADKPASEEKNPFGPNGPETVDNAVELLMINALLHVTPAVERTIKQSLLSPEDALALKTRAGKLSDSLYIEPDQRSRKRKLAAAAAYEIGGVGLSKAGFDSMVGDHPSLPIVERALKLVGQKDPGYAARFPHAIVNPPTPVTKQGRNGEVDGHKILLVGAMGDREQ